MKKRNQNKISYKMMNFKLTKTIFKFLNPDPIKKNIIKFISKVVVVIFKCTALRFSKYFKTFEISKRF